MAFNTGLRAGQVLSNQEIVNIFKCSNQGGMRRSLKTNTLVLISDRTKLGIMSRK
jgi:5-methylcytosine-specific restriction enzyme A